MLSIHVHTTSKIISKFVQKVARTLNYEATIPYNRYESKIIYMPTLWLN